MVPEINLSGACGLQNKTRPPALVLAGRVALATVFIAWILVFVATAAFSIINQPASTDRDVLASIVNIPSGLKTSEIGDLLETKGLITNSRYFTVLARIFDLDDDLQAGYYRIKPNMTVMEVIAQLQKGRVVTYRVTIPEGSSAREIADLLARKGLVDKERFLTLVNNESLVYGDRPPIAKPTPSLEGYLYPDTYLLAKGTTEEAIIRRLLAKYLEIAAPYIEKHNKTRFSSHEILTLASIIEKEAMVDRERTLISAVFHNRLNSSMPLQSDPTVHYVLETRGKLLYEDLQVDSPYNTYRYRGLPPGPIANPGLKSIWAAMNPEDVDYKYFVAKGNGTHAFSRTFQEHISARRQYGM